MLKYTRRDMQSPNEQIMVPSTLSVKIRGLEGVRSATALDLTPLAETHLIFNRFVEATCQEILRLKNSAESSKDQALAAFVEVAFKIPISAGNHLLTRLLQSHGKDNSDRKQISNLLNRSEKILAESSSDGAPISEALVTALEEARLNVAQSQAALALLDRRKEEQYAPWGKLTAYLPSKSAERVECHLSYLPESWQRQIFQAAIESLKSHFNLKKYVEEERKGWEKAVSEAIKSPEMRSYLAMRDSIVGEIKRHGEEKRFSRELTPLQLIEFIEKDGARLMNWRGSSAIQAALAGDVRISQSVVTVAKGWESLPEAGRSRRASEIRRDILSEVPEIRYLLKLHDVYEKSFARFPGMPTLTVPDPFNHPKYVIWSQQHWREIELGSGRGAESRWMKIRLPLLSVGEHGVEESPRWVTIRGDHRLAGIRKEDVTLTSEEGERIRTTKFLQRDTVSGREREIKFGGVRLVIDARSEDIESKNLPARGDYRLKLVVNKASTKPPVWVSEYLKGKEIDPKTQERRLPEKLMLLSLVYSPDGSVVMKAADILPASYGRRKVQYLNQAQFPPKLEIAQLSSSEQVTALRQRAYKIAARRKEFAEELASIPREDTSRRTERRGVVREILRCHRLERGIWRHLTNLSEDRSNRITGAVLRKVEELRNAYPEHEFGLVLDYRADRKPNSNKWSRDFNKLLMSSSSGKILENLAQSCERLDPPLPVLSFSTFGFDKRAPRSGEIDTLHFALKRNGDGQRVLERVPFSETVAVVRQGKDSALKISLRDAREQVADNLIERVVTPSRYQEMPDKKEIDAKLNELWVKAEGKLKMVLGIK